LRIGVNIEMSALRIGLDKAGPEFSRQNKKLLWLLEALIKCNIIYLASHPNTPLLYSSGVRYQREPRGKEEWQDIPSALKLLRGDCEDLAAWRAAELRQRGVFARGHLKWFHSRDVNLTLYHVQVKLPDGSIEDPSRKLGMKGRS
jgi:hypothetical protein